MKNFREDASKQLRSSEYHSYKAGIRAARKVENYHFKYGDGVQVDKNGIHVVKSKKLSSSDMLLKLMSTEMKLLEKQKFEHYKTTTDKWSDRLYTTLAKPLGAEIYLNCENGHTIFGAPGYYMDGIDAQDGTIPNGLARHPYSDEAHLAAKKIRFKLLSRFMQKSASAITIQKCFRYYILLKKFKVETMNRLLAANKIVWFVKKRKKNIERKKKLKFVKNINAAKIQVMVRAKLAYNNEKRIKEEFILSKVLFLQNWSRECMTYKKRKHGIDWRYRIHAWRLQRFIRGSLVRCKIWRMKDTKIKFVYNFRKYINRKYGHVAKVICHLYNHYRRLQLYKKVVKIQSMIRAYLGKFKFFRYKLLLKSEERFRLSEEEKKISKLILKSAVKDKKWKQIDETFRDNLVNIDLISSLILIGKIKSKSNPLPLSFNQRVVFAILSAFSNRSNGCIDAIALQQSFEFLTINETSLGNFKLNQDIGASLLKFPLHDISSLARSGVLKPNSATVRHAMITSHLPSLILVHGVLVRRWTRQLNKVVGKSIKSFRKKDPPRRFCKHCLEPMISDGELHKHRICPRNNYYSWIHKESLQPMVIVLTKKLKFWKHIPKFKSLPVQLELLTRSDPISHDYVIYGTQRKQKKSSVSINIKNNKGNSSVKDTDTINNSSILTSNSRASTHESTRQDSSSSNDNNKIDKNRNISGESRTGTGYNENSTLMSPIKNNSRTSSPTNNSYQTHSNYLPCYHQKEKVFNPTIIGNFFGHIHQETKLKKKLEAIELKKQKQIDAADVDLREKNPVFQDIIYDAHTFLDQSKKHITKSLIKWNNDHAINQANKYKMEEEIRIRMEELQRKEEFDKRKKDQEEKMYQSRLILTREIRKTTRNISIAYDGDTVSSYSHDDGDGNTLDGESNFISESESKLNKLDGGFISEDGGFIDFEADITNMDSIQDDEDGIFGDSDRPYIEYLDEDNPPDVDYLGYSSDDNDDNDDNGTKKSENTANSRGGTANSKAGSSRSGTPSGTANSKAGSSRSGTPSGTANSKAGSSRSGTPSGTVSRVGTSGSTSRG